MEHRIISINLSSASTARVAPRSNAVRYGHKCHSECCHSSPVLVDKGTHLPILWAMVSHMSCEWSTENLLCCKSNHLKIGPSGGFFPSGRVRSCLLASQCTRVKSSQKMDGQQVNTSPLKTNMSPENRWLEDQCIPYWDWNGPNFLGHMFVFRYFSHLVRSSQVTIKAWLSTIHHKCCAWEAFLILKFFIPKITKKKNQPPKKSFETTNSPN